MALSQSLKPINIPQAIQQALDFQRQGRLPQAEKLYSDVLALRPDYFEALNMLGLIKLQQGDLPGALRLMAAALQARPKSPELLLNYSLVLNSLGRYGDALAALDLALTFKRRSVEAHNNRGAILEKLGRDEEALESFQRALDIKSNHADAVKGFDRVLAIKPDYAKAHNNRGAALEKLERRDEAVASYERALALDPNFVEALNNCGNAMLKLGRHDEAIALYNRALAIDPFHVEVLNNRSNALAETGRHREALASSERAYAVNPNYVNAQWNAALLRLRLGDLAEGFKQYEWRWGREENAKRLRVYPQPLWLGQMPLDGKTILLHHEQGLGDTIQFARYAPILTKQAARVILEVQPPLKTLLSRIGVGVEAIGSGEEIPDFDLHCPLMSLPLALRTDLTTVPADIPYLRVPDKLIGQWNARMPERNGLRVGLVWSGNATHRDDRNRSLALWRLKPWLDVPGVQLISLQKELRDADAQVLADEARIADIGRQFGDFSATAAAVAAMDLVISVDTSVAHLAGALGKPVWVLLPLCPDWRWLVDRDDSPWYPTARLFRQPRIGDWDSVIGEVRRALAGHAQAPGA